MINRKKILITGLTGLIGSRIAEILSHKYEFIGMNLENGVDITNMSLVAKFLSESKADTVLHLAAFTDTNAAWKENGDKNGNCYRVNVLGTKNIASACGENNKYLIHISTEYVFDGKKETEYTEKDLPNPLDWYAKTKYYAEKKLESIGCKYTIIRPSYPFRAKFDIKLDIVRKIIKEIKEKTIQPMFTDTIITPTFIDDLAVGLDIVIQKKPKGIYHLVGSTSLSPYQLAQQIAESFKINPDVIKKGSLVEYLKTSDRPYAKKLRISNKKAFKELGIRMKTLNESLEILKKQIFADS